MRHPRVPMLFVLFGLCMGGGRASFGQVVRIDVDGQFLRNEAVSTDFTIDASSIGSPPGTFNRINVYTVPENSGSIGHVTLSGTRSGGSSTFDLVVSNGALTANPDDLFSYLGAQSWTGVSSTNALRDAMRVGAALSGDLLGSMQARTIWRFKVGGNVRGSVTATGTGTAIRRLLVDGSIRATDPQNNPVVIEATSGDIEKVAAGLLNPSGGIFAPIRSSGSISEITASGAIGTTTALAQITASTGISSISGGEIHATVIADLPDAAGARTGDLGSMLAAGDLTGSVRAHHLNGSNGYGISAYGNLEANVELTGNAFQNFATNYGTMFTTTGNTLHIAGSFYNDMIATGRIGTVVIDGGWLSGPGYPRTIRSMSGGIGDVRIGGDISGGGSVLM